MTDTSATAPDPIAALRAALAAGDRAAVAAGLRQVPVAIGVDGSQPRVAIEGESRLLPIFLDMASWRAFGLPGEPLLLPHAKLADLLAALEHVDDVLVDPALPSAMRIPRADLADLLASSDGSRARADGFDPDAALADRARAALATESHPGAARAWAVQRVTADARTPTIAVAHGVADAEIAAIASALGRADLPRELELVQLDEAWTRTARDAWSQAAVA